MEMLVKKAEKENEAENGTKNEPIKRAEREEVVEAPRIAEDVIVDVAGYVYPMDFIILDIREDEKRPFILGTPFLTTAKAVIKFDKDTITLRSRKSKISFHRIPKSLGKGLEVGSIRRIQWVGYGVLEFLGVGTTLDIFQNILFPYIQYGVLVFSGYGVLIFFPLWSFGECRHGYAVSS
ncbi:reverse transcriptase domain-containing protein [Tanacetum coccineum]